MLLKAGFVALALKLQEAATAVSHADIRARLSDAISEQFKDSGRYAWLVDVFGDDKSGFCVYSCNEGFMQANYKLRTTDSKATCEIDFSGAKSVVPHTSYTATESADPKADPKPKEAALAASAAMQLVESAPCFLREVELTESKRTSYPVKLISPGTGSTAHYPAEVLERDGPKVFKKGTLMFWNHPTAVEEAARPEGDLNNLAAILTSDARYEANGPKGAGLYAEAKVMADYAEKIEERAPHIGLSIRAGGQTSGRMVGGKPELKCIDYAESVDYVTKAGRGGLALAEAARDAGILESEEPESMTEDLKKLRETVESQQAVNARLLERALKGDAREAAAKILKGVSLSEVSRQRVIESVLDRPIPAKDGALDAEAFGTIVNAEAKREGEYVAQLTGGGRVTGMGAAPAADPIKAREATERQEADEKQFREGSEDVFSRLMGSKGAGKAAALKGAA